MKKILASLFLFFFAGFLFAQTVVEYDFNSGLTMEEFFEKNYRSQWEALDPIEQYAIAFSSNLFQQNHQFHLDFTGHTKLNDRYAQPLELLRDSWGITDYKSLVDMFNSLEESGHSGAYQRYCGLLDKYPDKSPVEIAALEHLEILDATRLFYVRDSRQAAGKRGIEAWDEGREITILRWGVACGYISKEEAKTLMKPVIERIIKNYSSWQQFSEHYWLGRGFYGLSDCSQSSKRGAAIYNDSMAHAYIPLDSIKFTGENAEEYHNALAFEEGPDFVKWQEVQKLSNQEVKEGDLTKLQEIEEEYSAYSDLFFWWHMVLLINFSSDEELINYVEDHYDYLQGFPVGGDVYYNSMYYYLRDLNDTIQPARALKVIAGLPENLQYNIHFYYQYAYANYLMLSFCSSQEEFDTYKARAKSAIKVLKEHNYEINVSLDKWYARVE